MGFHTTPIFLSTLSSLKAEEVKLVLHGGDFTDRGTPEEFHLAGACCDSVDIPIRGCLGNHDLYTASSTCDALAGSLHGVFPNGDSSYFFDMLGLRFWVLDSEKPGFGDSPPTPEENGKPLIILRHYALRNRGGVSSAGFRLLDWGSRQKDEEEALAHQDSFLFITWKRSLDRNDARRWRNAFAKPGARRMAQCLPGVLRVFQTYTVGIATGARVTTEPSSHIRLFRKSGFRG